MFHAEAGSITGRAWTAMARRDGDLIFTVDDSATFELGDACTDPESWRPSEPGSSWYGRPARERRCPDRIIADETWSPYA
jgi:hypothetical protein